MRTDPFFVPDWLAQRARSSPDHLALIGAGRTVSYAELAHDAAAAGGRLRRLGIQRGDRVALLMANRIEFAEIMYGAMRLGAVLVPLNPRLSAPEAGALLGDCRPAVLCYDCSARETVAALTPHMCAARVCVDADAAADDPLWKEIGATEGEPESRIDLQAVHSVVYTSGSSGRPKGVLLTYGNHFWSAVGSAFNLGVQPEDRWLACLSFAHVGGLSILLRSVIYGTTAVIHDHFDPEQVNRAIDEDRVTIVSVVAPMLQRMLEVRGERPYPPWLRCTLLGGGPAPRALLETCAARGLLVAQTYGLTEAASQVTTLAPRDARRKLGSAGRPLLCGEIRLVRDGVVVAPGEVGEIQVRGPTVSPGYLKTAPKGETAEDRRPSGVGPHRVDGWLSTGDLGRLDEEGFLYLVGRRDDIIITGGENVHPAEVEAVLEAHPAVAEACVAGAPDDRWGEAIVAYVRLREGADVDASALQAHARRSLAGFKIPRQVHFVDDFPRTASGKVLRRAVRERARGTAQPQR